MCPVAKVGCIESWGVIMIRARSISVRGNFLPLVVVFLFSSGAIGEEGPIGKVQQPIVGGTLLDNATQRNNGLVTVGGGCSGTLVNRYWVLTADHCVTSNGRINGPAAAFGSLQITAAWSGTVVIPTRLVRNWGASGLDVALIFLGNGDLGSVPTQLLDAGLPDQGMTVMKFGRGINAYAVPGPPPTAAGADGQYRSATFSVGTVASNTYTLQPNAAGQVGNGGDSGGPDWIVGAGGALLSIAGVQSTCRATGYVAGRPTNWSWATGISSCNSAPVGNIRSELIAITRFEHVAFCKGYGTQAAAAADANQIHGCGNGGPRWLTDAAAHVDWCISLNGDEGPPNNEAAARTETLRACPGAISSSDRPITIKSIGKAKPPPPEAPAPEAPPAPPAGLDIAIATVTGDVDVYDVPGGEGTVIGMLPEGAQVSAECRDDRWCAVTGDVPNGKGWVWGEFLAF